MNKKFYIIILILITVLIVAGFVYFYYHTRNFTEGNDVKDNGFNDNTNELPIQIDDIQIEGQGDFRGLIICVDKCGDGICQQTDPDCTENNQLNCICLETKENCPQDCK